MDEDKIIFEANKLIEAYNSRKENDRKLVVCNKGNVNIWLSIPRHIKDKIAGTELEKIFWDKFIHKASYIKISHNNYISETTFYTKASKIYEEAIYYMYYERLFIVRGAISAKT